MTESLVDSRHRHFGPGVLCALECIVLAPLAAFLVLWTIPSAFEIEWGCVSASGVSHTSGDTYIAGVAVLGTLGWIGVLLGVIFANIGGSSRIVAWLPIAWFLALVVGALVAAAAIGPQPCAS